MSAQITDTVIVGAGHAGLAISRHLQRRGTEHVVLERGRVAQSWASQRWESFHLNTPESVSRLPGDVGAIDENVTFASRDEFVEYLRAYVARHGLPIRENVEVTRVKPTGSGFEVEAGGERIACRHVVVCSGDQNVPFLPDVAAKLPDDIVQLHAADYRSPEALPRGAVLVVGSGQSGVQIAEDLLDAGREVYVCTSRVGRVPRRYRGRDLLHWMMEAGMGEHRPEDLPDPAEAHARQPQISGTHGGHSVSCHLLAHRGATLLGRLEGVEGRTLSVAADLLDNVAFGDALATKLRTGLEALIQAKGLEVPPDAPDPADEPFQGLDAMAARRTVDLDEASIRSVVFCTGFRGRFDFLDPELLGDDGRPRHRDGACEVPGLYCLGFTWLRRRISGLVAGIDDDAAHVASLIAAS